MGRQAQLIERPTVASSADGRATTVLQDLWADPTDAPPLDAIASAVGMSRRSLTRHIRARTGGSLGEWLRRAPLARAQDLLSSGATGLEDVAARSGFAKRAGASPGLPHRTRPDPDAMGRPAADLKAAVGLPPEGSVTACWISPKTS